MTISPCAQLIAQLAIVLIATGCDTGDRLNRLEKQTKELQEEVGRQRTTADYDLQAKCSRDAREWFKENWSSDQHTLVLHYTNHYDKSLNKCFILVEHHFSFVGSFWTNAMTLTDVYENSEYGTFSENHGFARAGSSREPENSVVQCEFLGTNCKTLEEFNALVRPYLSN